MPRTTPSKRIVLGLLTEGSTRAADLAAAAGIKHNAVKSVISRLRDDGFLITSEATETAGDPRYRLISGPGSQGPSFVCPGCRLTIRLGSISDHKTSCPFGAEALRELTKTAP